MPRRMFLNAMRAEFQLGSPERELDVGKKPARTAMSVEATTISHYYSPVLAAVLARQPAGRLMSCGKQGRNSIDIR